MFSTRTCVSVNKADNARANVGVDTTGTGTQECLTGAATIRQADCVDVVAKGGQKPLLAAACVICGPGSYAVFGAGLS